MTITARHNSNPEKLEAAIYHAAGSGPVVVRLHGFDPAALAVILSRLPSTWRVQRDAAKVTINPGTRNTEPGGAGESDDLKAVTFNGYVGQRPELLRAHLEALAQRTKADIIALQEGKRFHGTIPGYHAHRVAAHGDDANNVFLVRAGVHVTDAGHLETGGGTYHGPHGGTRAARVFPWLEVDKGGQAFHVLNVHRATRTAGADDNRAAEDRAIRAWFDAAGDAAAVALGDWNSGDNVMQELAHAVGGGLSFFAPDGALFRNARVVEKRRFRGRFGSDHHRPIAYTFRAR